MYEIMAEKAKAYKLQWAVNILRYRCSFWHERQ